MAVDVVLDEIGLALAFKMGQQAGNLGMIPQLVENVGFLVKEAEGVALVVGVLGG